MTHIPDIDPLTISLKDQLKACGREIGMRKSLYPGFIEMGNMTEAKAAHELAAMRAIYGSLRRLEEFLAQPEEPAPDTIEGS